MDVHKRSWTFVWTTVGRNLDVDICGRKKRSFELLLYRQQEMEQTRHEITPGQDCTSVLEQMLSVEEVLGSIPGIASARLLERRRCERASREYYYSPGRC